MRKDKIKMSLAEFYLSPWMVAMYIVGAWVALVILFVWISSRNRPNIEETTQTAEEIKRNAPPIIDWRENERRRKIIHLHRERKSQREIEMDVFGYTGGAAHEYVKEVIESTPTPPDYHGEGLA